MLHLSNKDRLSIKIYSKDFLTIVDFYFSDSDVDFLEKIKPSEPYPVIQMIKLCHSIQITIDEKIKTNQNDGSSKEKKLFEKRH
jgi:hypothetical protein